MSKARHWLIVGYIEKLDHIDAAAVHGGRLKQYQGMHRWSLQTKAEVHEKLLRRLQGRSRFSSKG